MIIMNYDLQKTSYKEYAKPKLKKYKNPNFIFTVNSIMSLLERIAIGVFSWNGLDGNGIALSRKVEEYLFYFKRCAIVETKEVGLAVVRIVPVGLNIYNEPAGYNILTCNGIKLTPVIPRTNGLEGEIGTDNAIILTDSQTFNRGRIDGLWHWVTMFADAQISVDQQMVNQRSPLFAYIKSKNQEQIARVEMIDVNSGLNALIIDDDMRDVIKPFNLEGQFNVEKINNMQHEYLARALSSLGVDSMQSFGKKERMIVDEVESNDEYLAMILVDSLNARNKPLINNATAQKFGISCEISKPYRISTYKDNHTFVEDKVETLSEVKEKETIEGDISD